MLFLDRHKEKVLRFIPINRRQITLLMIGTAIGLFFSIPIMAQCDQTPKMNTAPESFSARTENVARWIIEQNQRPSGAIVLHAIDKSRIVPYFANHAAWGLVPYKKYNKEIRAYLDWYFARLNRPDRFGRIGTVYDYEIRNGQEVSTNDYDSADAYAGTFLTLVRAWYESDPATTRAYLASHRADLETIAIVIISLQQPDGLTWAKDNYRVKYLLDNAEAYAGLRDLAAIGPAIGIAPQLVDHFKKSAAAIQDGINRHLWDAARGHYMVGLHEDRKPILANLAVWYPDAIAQMSIIMNEVPSRLPYTTLYNTFLRSQPDWYLRDGNGNFKRQGYTEVPEFPFVLVAYAARLIDLDTAWTAYSDNIIAEYMTGANAFRWPWNTGDAGVYLLLNAPTQRLAIQRLYGRGSDNCP